MSELILGMKSARMAADAKLKKHCIANMDISCTMVIEMLDMIDTLTEQVRALTAAIEAHKRVSHGDAGYLGNPDVASDLRLWAILPTPPKEAE